MYMVGADHPNKTRTATLFSRHSIRGDRMVTDAEVYQEILHRFRSLNRPHLIQGAFDFLDEAVDEVFPITRSHVESAKLNLLAYPLLSARDALHVAVMKAYGIGQVMSFDSALDQVIGISRIY